MAFNNVFPATYQQYYPQFQQQNYQAQPAYQTQQAQNSSIIWVQGEAGAKSYLVAPNTTVQLWDSESQTIYLKSADASGMPSIKTLDYTIRENASQGVSGASSAQHDKAVDYATKSELDALEKRLERIRDDIDSLTIKRSVKKVSDDE